MKRNQFLLLLRSSESESVGTTAPPPSSLPTRRDHNEGVFNSCTHRRVRTAQRGTFCYAPVIFLSLEPEIGQPKIGIASSYMTYLLQYKYRYDVLMYKKLLSIVQFLYSIEVDCFAGIGMATGAARRSAAKIERNFFKKKKRKEKKKRDKFRPFSLPLRHFSAAPPRHRTPPNTSQRAALSTVARADR